MAETGKKRTLETLVANVRRRQKRDKDGGSRFDVTGLLTCCLEAHNFSEYHAALAGVTSPVGSALELVCWTQYHASGRCCSLHAHQFRPISTVCSLLTLIIPA